MYQNMCFKDNNNNILTMNNKINTINDHKCKFKVSMMLYCKSTNWKQIFYNWYMYLLLELIEFVELWPVIEGFLVLSHICSRFLPGLIRIEKGLKSVTQFGIKSLNKIIILWKLKLLLFIKYNHQRNVK